MLTICWSIIGPDKIQCPMVMFWFFTILGLDSNATIIIDDNFVDDRASLFISRNRIVRKERKLKIVRLRRGNDLPCTFPRIAPKFDPVLILVHSVTMELTR